MSHHDVIILVDLNERSTPEPLPEKGCFEFHNARKTILQSKGLRAFASLGECHHPRTWAEADGPCTSGRSIDSELRIECLLLKRSNKESRISTSRSVRML